MGPCCCYIRTGGENIPLTHCDRIGCTSRADYRTSCGHNFCYSDVVRIGEGSVPGYLQWKCLKETCNLSVNPDRFSLNPTGQNRTYTEITSRMESEKKKWIAAAASIALIFIGGFSYILSQE